MTPEVRMHPLDEICLMCCKLIDGPGSTPIFESPDLINLFTGVIGIQLKKEQYLPENICLTCSFTLYRMLEIQRMTKRNIMHHKMNHQYRNVGEKSKLLLGATFSPEPTAIRNSNPNGLIISEVRGHVQVADDHFHYAPYEEDFSPDGYLGGRSPKRDPASPSSNNSRNSTRLLRPIYMQVENVRDTESDGAIYGNTTSFQCDMCSKIFARRNHMTRHMNSHRARSRAESRSGSRGPDDRKKRVYRCKMCLEEFPERRTAMRHKLTHQKALSCPSCARVFHLKRELDWHEAECVGRQNADGVLGRRSRRLQDRFLDDDCGPHVRRDTLRFLTKTPTLSERLQSVQKWCNSAAPGASIEDTDSDSQPDEDTRSTISRFTSVSQKTALTCISSRSGWSASSISIRTDYSYKSAKTVRTLKDERDYLQSCRVTRSIASRVKQIDLEIKVRELPHRAYGSTRSRATSRRHFDITRRAKPARKNRRMALPDAFTCDCGFTTKMLKEFMEHEVSGHKKLPLFTCRECNERFTQRRFLEKHQESHNKTYTCVWCFAKFLNESELKTHLELHALSSTPCGFCEAAFVSQHELREHLEDMHSAENARTPQKSGILIRIGQKRRHEVQQEKNYRSRDLPQKTQPEDHRKTARTYSRYRAIRLGTVGREKSFEEEAGTSSKNSQVENGLPDAPREHILLPVAMDFCRYSTPSPQISDTHERGSTKVAATPPPSLEELGVFDTDCPLTNGNTSDRAASPEKSPYRLEEDEEDHSPIASPTGRRRRSRIARITLSQRVTRQTVAQPLPPTVNNILPPYESWPLDGTAIAVKPGILPQPCRMT